MKSAEFEAEARRVLWAFGLDERIPLKIKQETSDNDPWVDTPSNRFEAVINVEDIGRTLRVIRRVGPTKKWLGIELAYPLGFAAARFILSDAKQFMQYVPNRGHTSFLMVRALFLLGYDIDSLFPEVQSLVSAHQRMEWVKEILPPLQFEERWYR